MICSECSNEIPAARLAFRKGILTCSSECAEKRRKRANVAAKQRKRQASRTDDHDDAL